MITLMLIVNYSASLDALIVSTKADPERYYCVGRVADGQYKVWPLVPERVPQDMKSEGTIPFDAFYAMQEFFSQDV
jgi:hypothetical protein